ncbi:MAG: DUF2808 domain-containing protein [Phormidesmis sp.]
MTRLVRSLSVLTVAAIALSFQLVATAQERSPSSLDENAQMSPSVTPASNPNISFRRPLRLTNIRIPIDRQFRRTQYLFTVDFPADAVEPLEKLTLEQIEGVDYPRYRTDDSYAFEAGSRSRFSTSTFDDDDARTVTVEFDPPVEPGQQVTVALRARNPRDGIYQYRLTAFPVGAIEGQYAGIERFNIYAPERRDRFFR